MPPHPINNRSSTTRRNDLIKANTPLSLAMRPCKRCSVSGRRCRMGDSSEKCTECVSAGAFCDLAIPPAKLRRVHQQRLAMRQKVKEAKTKWMRLEKQLEKLETDEEELVAAEWQNISEKELGEGRPERAGPEPAPAPLIDIASEQLLLPDIHGGQFMTSLAPDFDFSFLSR